MPPPILTVRIGIKVTSFFALFRMSLKTRPRILTVPSPNRRDWALFGGSFRRAPGYTATASRLFNLAESVVRFSRSMSAAIFLFPPVFCSA